MTVTELRVELENAEFEGKGDWPVQMMDVDGGITYAVNLDSAFVANDYDGERFWIVPKAQRLPPEWAA